MIRILIPSILLLIFSCSEKPAQNITEQPTVEAPVTVADPGFNDSLLGTWLHVEKNKDGKWMHSFNRYDYLQVRLIFSKEKDGYFIKAHNSDLDGNVDSVSYKVLTIDRVYAGQIVNVMEYNLELEEVGTTNKLSVLFTPVDGDVSGRMQIWGFGGTDQKKFFYESNQSNKFIMDDYARDDEDM